MPVVEKKINFEPKQAAFFESTARFPCFKASWGTGKTMTAIFKGILLSNIYKNNLGLIVRRKFTDLRDSTLKDFERYTGLKVPMSTKEVTIPGTNSVIMFRHGDELSGLQNVNLGWAYIEQAEEFDSTDEFDMLRGRLRRELEINEKFEAYPPFDGLVAKLKSGPVRQIMLIANANGHNWIWRNWTKYPQPEHELHEMTTFENWENLPKDFIEDLKSMEVESPKKYRRYVNNSDEEEDIVGAYYGEKLAQLRKQGRITKVSLRSSSPVYVVMDVGYTTAIWLFQPNGTDVNFIKYYQDAGVGVDGYAKLLLEWAETEGYRYGAVYTPVDMDNNAHRVTRGETALEVLREYNFNVKPLPKERSVTQDGIPRTRRFLDRCWFDAEECEYGLDCLEHYRERTNESLSTETKKVFTGMPLKDGCDHGADALRYGSMVFEKGYFEEVSGAMSPREAKELYEKYAPPVMV